MRYFDLLAVVLLLTGCAGAPERREPSAAVRSSDAGHSAEPPTPAAASRALPLFRLPPDVKPTSQQVSLEVLPDQEEFRGKVEIALQLEASREELWVSSRELRFESGALRTARGTSPVRVEPDDGRGVARIVPGEKVPAGDATLTLTFSGRYNSRLVGVYRLKTPGGWAAYTQFEAIDARRAFPCFDEPAFKIPWELELVVPEKLQAFANTSELEVVPAGPGLKRIRFRPTRPLPSYLVAFAVGDFDVQTPPPLAPTRIRPGTLQVRGIAPKGRGSELGYALRAGAELLPALEQWFGVAYPYEKLDHLAEPDFAHGAMENAGLITYVDGALLIREQEASTEDRMGVAEVVAHEMAHQWFGDLVTMRFWDDVWLNESFATFMEPEVVGPWDPSLGSEMTALRSALWAMENDELESARAIRQPIRTEGDIQAWDDGVLYPKGAAVLRMFQSLLGRDEFRAGIRRYLEAHRDGNATTEDLLAALSVTRDIGPAFRTFIDQPGIPRIRGQLTCDGRGARLALHQERARPLGSKAPPLLWQVPVCVRAEGLKEQRCTLLTGPDDTLSLPGRSCPRWVHLNAGARGYYRWLLSGREMDGLLRTAWGKLPATERLSAADTLVNGARDGLVPASELLARLPTLVRDADPLVSAKALEFLKGVRGFWSSPELDSRLRASMRAQFRPVLARLGWSPRGGESTQLRTFRATVVEFLALDAGDSDVLARASRLGRAWLGSDGRLHPEAVPPDLRDAAARAMGRAGDARTFDLLEERLKAAGDAATRYSLVMAMASFRQPELAERARALAVSPDLRHWERVVILRAHALTPELRVESWRWVVTHLDALGSTLAENSAQNLASMQMGCSEAEADQLSRDMEPLARSNPGLPYHLKKAVEKTRLCAATRAVQAPSVAAFLSSGAPVQERSVQR